MNKIYKIRVTQEILVEAISMELAKEFFHPKDLFNIPGNPLLCEVSCHQHIDQNDNAVIEISSLFRLY